MAIILDEENNVVRYENQPEEKRLLFKNISYGDGAVINDILERLDRIYPATNAGYISNSGTIQNVTSDAEVYTDEFPVTPGDTVSVTLKYSQDRSMWLAYCLYDANHTFISRTMLVNSITQSDASMSFTVPGGAYYCRLTYRSFNDATITIDTTGQILHDVQVSGQSVVRNGVAYIEETVTVSGTTPVITATAGKLYICGEVSTLGFTPSAKGICEVIFRSGSTATVLTLPSTVKMPDWFDITALDTNTIYDISIAEGVYGAVMSWSI